MFEVLIDEWSLAVTCESLSMCVCVFVLCNRKRIHLRILPLEETL